MGDRVVNFVLKGHDQASSIFKGVYVDAVGAIRGIIDVARSIGNAFESSIEKARGQEEADLKLAASLSNVKGATSETLDTLVRYASQLQATTGVEDDAVEGLMQLFASFGNTEQAIKDATKAALDFAAGTGMSAESAALALQKAANGNVGALGRYGIALDRAGVKGRGMAYVAEEIEKRFKGMSEAAMAGVHGGLTAVGNSFGDLQEALGSSLTHSRDLEMALAGVDEALQVVTKAATDAGTSIGTVLAQGIGLTVQVLGRFVELLPEAARGILEFAAFSTAQLRSFFDLAFNATLKLTQLWGKNIFGVDTFAKLVIQTTQAERAFQSLADGASNTLPGLQKLGRDLQGVGEQIQANLTGGVVDTATSKVKGLGEASEETAGKVDKAAQALAAAWAEADEDIRQSLGGIEKDLRDRLFVGWGDDQQTAIRAVILEYDALREKLEDATAWGYDTSKALADAATAQAREIEAVNVRFARKAEKDLAKEGKQTEKLGEDLGGFFGRGIRAAIQGDAQSIIGTVVGIFGRILSMFGGPLGGILGSVLGGIFHEGSGDVHGRVQYAHEGLGGLYPDERMLIYRTPEAVLNQRGVAAAGGRDAVERMNRGYDGGGASMPQVSVNVQVDGSRMEARDFRFREIGPEVRRQIRYGTSEWARGQRAGGFAPGR